MNRKQLDHKKSKFVLPIDYFYSNFHHPLQNKNQPQYFPALDGLRFFAFLVVFGCHIFQGKTNENLPDFFNYLIRLFDFGYLAVDLFFLLSAFLISWWSFTEKQNFGNFSFKKYFIRRALRIWPLYFLMIFFCQAIILLQSKLGADVSEIPSFIYHFTFTLNFACLKNDQFLMVILWSISVEEQYYLFSGILQKFNKHIFLIANIFLLIASFVFRYQFNQEKLTLHYHTLSVIGSFCMGNLLAFSLFYYKEKWIYLFRKPLINAAYFGFAGLIFFYSIFIKNIWFVAFEKLIVGLFFIVILIDQAILHQFFMQLKEAKRLNYLGKISYGLYCYHGLVIGVCINLFPYFKIEGNMWNDLVLLPVASFLSTIIVSHISYVYFESYFLKLKYRFYPIERAMH